MIRKVETGKVLPHRWDCEVSYNPSYTTTHLCGLISVVKVMGVRITTLNCICEGFAQREALP